MKRIVKKALAVTLAVVMVFGAAPLAGFMGFADWFGGLTASAEDYSGTCGYNLTWSLDTSTGVLTISGTGAMDDNWWFTPTPWDSYKDTIKNVTIGNSVTSIGDMAFFECISLLSVTIGNSVTSIGYRAFYSCTSLTSVTIPDSVTSIGSWAFRHCTGLTSVTIPDSVTSIGSWAFYDTAYYNNSSNWENNTVLYIGKHLIEAKKTISGNYIVKSGTICVADHAFSNCEGLTSITIPDSVTSIGLGALFCIDKETMTTSLMNITVDSANQYYSSDSYGVLFNKDKTTLIQYPIGNARTSYEIPDSVTSIGDEAFSGCTGLTNVTIGNSVTSIGDEAFSGCTSLTSVTIPNSVTSIGEDAFYYCISLTSVTVDSANQYYLSDSYGVLFNKDKTTLIQYPIGNTRTSYEIPDSVTSIGDDAFSCCTGLTNVTIPDSVTSIGDYAFDWCLSLTSITVDDTNQYYSSDSYGVLFNKGKTTLIQYPAGNPRTSYTLPNGVTSIRNYAFFYCTGLTSVTISDSVTSIGNYAFLGCSGLTSVTIPDSVTSIGETAFYGCIGLTDVYYSGTESNWNAINIDEGNEHLTSATIHFNGSSLLDGTCGDNLTWSLDTSTGVLTISGTGAMDDWEYSSYAPWYSYRETVKSVTIGNNVTSIGNSAFYSCDSLTSVTIGKGVTSLGLGALFCIDIETMTTSLMNITVDSANQYYSSDSYGVLFNKDKTTLIQYPIGNARTSYEIPDSVTSIGDGAFYDCTGLTSVTIGNSVMSIGDEAFGGCTGLTSVTIPNSVTSIGDAAFWGCAGLTSVTIGNSVTSIGLGAFCYCYGLTSVTIGNSVTSIGDAAFGECTSLTNVTIPDSVTSIGEYAFGQCTGLTDVYYSGTESNWNAINIDEGNEYLTSATIHFNSVFAMGISLNKENLSLAAGKTSQLTATITPANASDKSVTWSSSDENVATVSATGLVTAKAVGTATITATADDTTNGTLTDTCLVTVTPHVHNYVSAVTTAPTCTKTGVTTYTCSECGDSYTRLIPALGHSWGAWVTVKEPTTENGLKKRVCSLCGAVETEILPAVSANFTVDAILNQTYTGFAITANVRAFSKADSSRLDEYEHFMVDYENNTAAGTATAVVTGIGSYHGTVSVNFNISAADIGGARVEAIPSVTCKGNAITPDPVIRYGRRLLVNGTDYTLAYANNISPGTATITVTGKGGFSGSRTISFTILENNANFSVSEVGTQAWTGGTLTPDITVMSAGAAQAKSELAQSGGLLTEGVDYTLDYSGSTDIGFGTVTVTGIGNYSGTTKLIFRIECADINGASVADISGAAYTGAAYTPNLTGKITFGEYTLVEGTDYIVEISRNVLVGTAKIDIIGIDNYSGTFTLYADITPADISGSEFTVDGIADVTYNGAAHTPEVTLRKDGEALALGSDYTISYSNNISAGTATATVTGVGNYSGTRTATFEILTVPPESITLSSTALSLQYKGTSKLTVTFSPTIATNKTVTWTSSNEKVAIVDANGNVTATGRGTATITATSEDGGKTANCTVTVKLVWWQWLIKILLFGWIWY